MLFTVLNNLMVFRKYCQFLKIYFVKCLVNNVCVIQGFYSFRVTFVFGVITCFGGICGVVLGSLSSQCYRRYNPRADPLICAYSMIAAVPFVFFACVFASSYVSVSYVSIL